MPQACFLNAPTDCHASLRTGVAMTGFFDSLSSLYTREPFIQCNTEDFLSV